MIGALVLLALAVLCIPCRSGLARLRRIADAWPRSRWRLGWALPSVLARTWIGVAAGLVGCVGIAYLILGPAGALACALLGVQAMRRWRQRKRSRSNLATLRGISVALGTLVAELRAGTHPAVAAKSAAQDAGEVCTAAGAALHAVGSSARLGSTMDPAVVHTTMAGPATRRALGQLVRGWALAHRYGIPLADVLESVRRDLDAGARISAGQHARMAGPRTSAALLAALPVLGIALGELMGARPLSVLAGSIPGQLLLLVGAALIIAGSAWSARITGQELAP